MVLRPPPKLVNPPTFRILQNSGVILLVFIGILAVTAHDLVAEEPAPAPAPPAPPSAPAPTQAPTQAPSASAAPNPTAAPAAAWEKRHAGDVAMESPYPIEDGPDSLARAPERVRSTLVSVKTYKTGGPKRGFEVSVTAVTYRPGVPVNIDEAIKSVTDKILARVGNPDHKFIIQPVKISGFEARQSQFHGTVLNDKPFYAALAVVQDGQTLWQVQAICVNEAVVQDAARIMNSIAIEPVR